MGSIGKIVKLWYECTFFGLLCRRLFIFVFLEENLSFKNLFQFYFTVLWFIIGILAFSQNLAISDIVALDEWRTVLRSSRWWCKNKPNAIRNDGSLQPNNSGTVLPIRYTFSRDLVFHTIFSHDSLTARLLSLNSINLLKSNSPQNMKKSNHFHSPSSACGTIST